MKVDRCPNCQHRLEQRSGEQNSRLHALLQEVSEQVKWSGQYWDVEDWKRLLTAAWIRASGGHPVMVPAVDGNGFDVLYRRTSRLSKQEASDLMEFVTAWAIEQGVKLREAA